MTISAMPPIVSRSKILFKFFYLFSALGTMRLFSMVINASIFTKFDYIWDSHKPQQKKNCIQILTEDCQIKLLSCRVWTWNLIHFFIFYMCVLERMKDVLSVCDVKEEIIGWFYHLLNKVTKFYVKRPERVLEKHTKKWRKKGWLNTISMEK